MPQEHAIPSLRASHVGCCKLVCIFEQFSSVRVPDRANRLGPRDTAFCGYLALWKSMHAVDH